VPTHLCRGPLDPANPEIAAFYVILLAVLKQTAFRDGAWSQIQPQPAWAGNWTSDDFVAYGWAGEDGSRYLVVLNYAGNQGQCRLPLSFPEIRGKQVRLTDVMGPRSTIATAVSLSITASTSIIPLALQRVQSWSAIKESTHSYSVGVVA